MVPGMSLDELLVRRRHGDKVFDGRPHARQADQVPRGACTGDALSIAPVAAPSACRRWLCLITCGFRLIACCTCSLLVHSDTTCNEMCKVQRSRAHRSGGQAARPAPARACAGRPMPPRAVRDPAHRSSRLEHGDRRASQTGSTATAQLTSVVRLSKCHMYQLDYCPAFNSAERQVRAQTHACSSATISE